MKKLIAALLLLVSLVQTMPSVAVTSAQEAAKSIQQSQESVPTLNNGDVLTMVKANIGAEIIIAKIKSSDCNFETSPAILQQLKADGVPDAVILAMVLASKGAAAKNRHTNPPAPPRNLTVKIPNLTIVEIEAPYTMTSQELRKGEPISFRVVNPVKIDGVTVIAAGATATARVVKAERGGHFGRAGRLVWTMQDVTAVDGTRIPLQATDRIVGDSKGAKVATEMILTGAAFMVLAPLALLHGFKRGENAVLPAGKRLEAFVQGDVAVNATVP